jgi:hypothetical protein
MTHTRIGSWLLALLVIPAAAQAQERRLEIGGQVVVSKVSEFDQSDIGLGVRGGWRAVDLLGLEAELNVYPRELPNTGTAFSAGRVEGLFGVTIGPQLGRVRPFARVRPGVLRYREAPEPVACILIFPPPLSCTLASGQTLFALDLGGGVEVAAGPRMLFRFDAGDRLVRYPEPNDTGHDVRVAAGWAFRF